MKLVERNARIALAIIGGEVLALLLAASIIWFTDIRDLNDLIDPIERIREFFISLGASRAATESTELASALFLFPLSLLGILLMGVLVGTDASIRAMIRVALVKPIAYAILVILDTVNHEGMANWYYAIDRFIVSIIDIGTVKFVVRTLGIGEYVTLILIMFLAFGLVYAVFARIRRAMHALIERPAHTLSALVNGIVIIALVVFIVT